MNTTTIVIGIITLCVLCCICRRTTPRVCHNPRMRRRLIRHHARNKQPWNEVRFRCWSEFLGEEHGFGHHVGDTRDHRQNGGPCSPWHPYTIVDLEQPQNMRVMG